MRGNRTTSLLCRRPAVDDRLRRRPPSRRTRPAPLASLLLAALATGSALAAPPEPTGVAGGARGVVAPNLRFGLHYDYLRQEKTASPISIGHHEGHRTRAELVGAVPVYGPVGFRAWLRGSIGHAQRSLDGAGRGNNELSILGTGGEVLVRDAEVGEIALGGGWDRVARDGPIDANAYHGRAAVSIFYPDLGLGPIDWRVDLLFTHRDVSGTGGPVDVDSDRWVVSGHAAWYANPNCRIAFGGRWDRGEYEFATETDAEGFVQVRLWLPRRATFGVPVELAFGGSGGRSTYKQPGFPEDDRALWGANAGLVFRFGSGETLLEAIRAYD